MQAPEVSPVLLAAYQPWFGKPSHIDVGYSSLDRVTQQKQIEEAKRLGISAFVVNWYGPGKDFEDRAYATLQQTAAANNFRVALQYDEHGDSNRSTEQAISDLRYAYDRYMGPSAIVPTSAYLTYHGRPMIFIFPKDGKTDWRRVRDSMRDWQVQPLLIYETDNSKYADVFDGFYAWVHPGKGGWTPDGSNWGEEYLKNFYKRMSGEYKDKIAIGAAWPGFDDERASWRRNRRMDYRCGRTFDQTLRTYHQYFNGDQRLPFLMIVTWNDYEEGTAIERGLQNCGGGQGRSQSARK